MIIGFIFVSLFILFLIALMFLILKNTVKTINIQAKAYFVDKLQEYDDLINERENKLNEINETIKNKKKETIEDTSENGKSSTLLDHNVIDLMNEARYQEKNVLAINRKINDEFNIDYVDLIKDFIALVDKDDQYEFCLNLRNKFDNKKVYELMLLLPKDLDKELHNFLTENEYKVYEIYQSMRFENNIKGFVTYLDELIQLNNHNIKILVGSKNENYDYLDKNIKTIVSREIYKGIKIIYKNKLYDYSLSERNG